MSVIHTKEVSANNSSSFLLRFLGKVTTVTKDGQLGINTKPLGDVTNKKSKTSLIRIDDENYLSVPK